ncbi:MAG: integration host factor subunit alpha [Candidatus Dadabacteria bacterium]|nr:MAG: integration host factor subunit alpha [Candidatus Dadabacteria bacterium]
MTDKNKHCVTKAELAEAIHEKLPVDKQKAAQIVEDYIELIKEALEKEGKVMLSGFGSYEVKSKPARRGRNPQTGETITLRARRVVKFKPSQLLRKALNEPRGDLSGS